MKTPRLWIDLTAPGAGLIQALGIGLLAAAFLHVQMATYFPSLPVVWFKFALVYLAVLASFGNAVLSIIIIARSLFGNLGSSPETFRFIHFSVFAHAAPLLPVIRFIDTWWAPAEAFFALLWTSLAGAALALAALNGSRRSLRFAILGAAASIAAFGCAVGYAPAIYGWDLRPLGWYAILVTAVPVLAFLVVFLRRAPALRRLRPLRYGLAAALFIALACGVGFQMASNPNNEFSESLRTALDSRPSGIRFSELTDFEWDTVEMYGAYTYPEQISPAVREGADIVSLSYFEVNDGLEFAAFLRDGEVVYYEAFWTDGYSFHFPPGSRNPIVLKPEDAVFIVEYDSGGNPSLTLED